MAKLLGFGPEDSDLVMSLWPRFLAWFCQERNVDLLVDPPSALTGVMSCLLAPVWSCIAYFK
jgi:hypothetical protein